LGGVDDTPKADIIAFIFESLTDLLIKEGGSAEQADGAGSSIFAPDVELASQYWLEELDVLSAHHAAKAEELSQDELPDSEMLLQGAAQGDRKSRRRANRKAIRKQGYIDRSTRRYAQEAAAEELFEGELRLQHDMGDGEGYTEEQLRAVVSLSRRFQNISNIVTACHASKGNAGRSR
jgi:hypothetical protein